MRYFNPPAPRGAGLLQEWTAIFYAYFNPPAPSRGGTAKAHKFLFYFCVTLAHISYNSYNISHFFATQSINCVIFTFSNRANLPSISCMLNVRISRHASSENQNIFRIITAFYSKMLDLLLIRVSEIIEPQAVFLLIHNVA